jgi:hypothetical protein
VDSTNSPARRSLFAQHPTIATRNKVTHTLHKAKVLPKSTDLGSSFLWRMGPLTTQSGG